MNGEKGTDNATMSQEQLLAMPFPAWAEDQCHLFLWTTNAFMRDALDLMEAWGFVQKTILTWAKPRIGVGSYFRNQTEASSGIKGELRTRRFDISTLFEGPIGRHSAKPESFYKLFEVPPILLMARPSSAPQAELHQPVCGPHRNGRAARGSAMTARAGQFVRLLGSDRDGEALNAVRALGKLLASHGKDWHWLADVADRHLLALPTGARAEAHRPPWQLHAEDLLQRGGAGLSPAERKFLIGMAHWRGNPTVKQATWLDDIAESLGAREAAA